jgi:hypothetical protein
LDEEKSKHAGLAQQNGFGQHFCSVKRQSKTQHMLEKSVINMISGLLPVSDWSR